MLLICGLWTKSGKLQKQATSWNLEEAIQLFYIGNESGPVASSPYSPPIEEVSATADQSSG